MLRAHFTTHGDHPIDSRLRLVIIAAIGRSDHVRSPTFRIRRCFPRPASARMRGLAGLGLPTIVCT